MPKNQFEQWLDDQQSFVGLDAQAAQTFNYSAATSTTARPLLDDKLASGAVVPNAGPPHPHLSLDPDNPLRFVAHEADDVQVVGVPPDQPDDLPQA